MLMGPRNSKDIIHIFWQDFVKEVILEKEKSCKIIIQMDANAKLGCEIIKNDPHKLSYNGSLLSEIISRQNLAILNANVMCEGVITRHRKTINSDEKSVIDYILVCDFLVSYLQRILIDEERNHVLTKYKKSAQSESDHNLMFAKFTIEYSRLDTKTKREIFNFRNKQCQQTFFEVTDITKKLSSCF